MENIVIIGSGFSALITYLKFKKFKPTLITATNKNYNNLYNTTRKNLDTNKILSSKGSAIGNFKFNLKNKTKIHDRLSLGGYSNIWGGFININSLPNKFISQFKNLGINFTKLDQKKNGYLSNNKNLRQLRDANHRILDTSFFLENYIDGFVHSLELKKDSVMINYYSEKNNILESITTSKLFLGISFPQLIDLLFRSNLLKDNAMLRLSEFEHRFILNTKSQIKNNNTKNVIIKYDFVRSLKHFLGLQKSFDNLSIKLPLYVDQEFLNKKNCIDFDMSFNNKTINQISGNKFGSSIHYCNLCINQIKINDYLNIFSKNIFGVSMPFIDQEKPGPISNNIINNIWKNF